MSLAFEIEALGTEDTVRVTACERGERLTFGALLALWRDMDARTDAFTAALAGVPFGAYFFETPALTHARVDEPFECVLVRSRSLAGLAADPEPFREHLEPGRAVHDPYVASFWNLGGDALLVAPRIRGAGEACAHLASFLRRAPKEEIRALWAEVSRCVESRLGTSPIWTSTSGLGVAWLHVRIDSTPKYYQHDAYRGSGRAS